MKAIKRGRVQLITGRETDDVYMERYIVFKSLLFSIYLHRFLRSDHDVPHDHPWSFLTYVARVGYEERVWKRHPSYLVTDPPWMESRVVVKPGSWVFRKSTHIHQVIIDGRYGRHAQSAPLTVNFCGPRHREWGFWPRRIDDEHGVRCWVAWFDYLRVLSKDKAPEDGRATF